MCGGSDDVNIAICEDKASEYEILECHVKECCDRMHLKGEIHRFETGAAFLSHFEKGRFQIVFMDIFMDGQSADGLKAAREIHKLDADCKIIFTTTSKEFGIESHDVAAVHYIVKPVVFEKVWDALDRCRDIIVREARYLTVISNRSERQILLKDILYIESLQKKLLIHTIGESIPTYTSLEQIKSGLDDTFLRCHKCYIVNMGQVRGMDGDAFRMTNDDRAYIRKRDTKAIKEAFAQYLFDKM